MCVLYSGILLLLYHREMLPPLAPVVHFPADILPRLQNARTHYLRPLLHIGSRVLLRILLLYQKALLPEAQTVASIVLSHS